MADVGIAVDIAQHVLVHLARRLWHHHQIVVVEIYTMMQIIDCFFDELGELRVLLQRWRKFEVLYELRAQRTAHLLGKLVAIVKTSAKSLHLIAVAREAHQVRCAIVHEIELKSLLLLIVGDAHGLGVFNYAQIALY